MTTRMIGARIPRNEDPRLLRGLGCFVDDIKPGGDAARGRAPQPARAMRASCPIDATRARALPGVHLVLTAADLGELNQPSPLLIPHPALTQPAHPAAARRRQVRYMGELVAFVVADDRYVAEDAVGSDRRALRAAARRHRARGRARRPGRRWCTRTCPGTARRRLVQRVGDPDAGVRPGRPRAPRAALHRAELRRAPSRRAASWPSTTRATGEAQGVDLDAGAAADQERARADLRPARVQGGGDRARHRRRLRHEDHALLSRGDPGAVRGDAARPARQVDRGPPSSTSSARARSAVSSTTSRSRSTRTGRILGLCATGSFTTPAPTRRTASSCR